MPGNSINKRPNEPGIISKFSMIILFGLICLCKTIKAGEGSVRMSFRTRRWHVPSRKHEPCWGKLRFAWSLHQSLSQFNQKFYGNMLVSCHDTMPSFMIFRRVLELSGWATIPRCLNFTLISCMGPRNSPKDTHVIFQTTLVHWSMCL